MDAGEGFEPLGRAYETTRSPESPRYLIHFFEIVSSAIPYFF
jgi:hypothetical protein